MENFDAFQSHPSVQDGYAAPAPNGHPFYQQPAHAQHPGVPYGAAHGRERDTLLAPRTHQLQCRR
ncbi:hypothetical protein EXIGLDRAFT_733885 [Exidia glandulosa HHB12029]|uniref:Uncharacterized protein n=1 Tax=Exidia glandulosa HHB12029 TaxID=1314781 RepID=A0A165B6Q4_EXIGL|nr:hypothetical protein EXIGLDRAFT_733885 [Exidia glandulosa HHB12029]